MNEVMRIGKDAFGYDKEANLVDPTKHPLIVCIASINTGTPLHNGREVHLYAPSYKTGFAPAVIQKQMDRLAGLRHRPLLTTSGPLGQEVTDFLFNHLPFRPLLDGKN